VFGLDSRILNKSISPKATLDLDLVEADATWFPLRDQNRKAEQEFCILRFAGEEEEEEEKA
jgi:hypothetical protein